MHSPAAAEGALSPAGMVTVMRLDANAGAMTITVSDRDTPNGNYERTASVTNLAWGYGYTDVRFTVFHGTKFIAGYVREQI